MTGKMDLRLSGSNTVSGGEYNIVRISGSGKINGNIKCSEIHCSGSAKVFGNLCSERVSASGSLSVEGDIICQTLSTSGSLKCKGAEAAQSVSCSGSSAFSGPLKADSLRGSGSVSVSGGIHCREITISGSCTASEGDVEAETFKSSGKLQIDTLLNAEHVDITPTSGSHIGSIGGSSIEITRPTEHGFALFRSKAAGSVPLIVIDSIEGDNVRLECTSAKVVRGKDVVIGIGCRIDRVEYTGTLDAADGTVKEFVRV